MMLEWLEPMSDDDRMWLLHECLIVELEKVDSLTLTQRMLLAEAYMAGTDLIKNVQWRTAIAGTVAITFGLPLMGMIMRAEAGRPVGS
jgi:hypothetical protein